jgi:hypothetical protein
MLRDSKVYLLHPGLLIATALCGFTRAAASSLHLNSIASVTLQYGHHYAGIIVCTAAAVPPGMQQT